MQGALRLPGLVAPEGIQLMAQNWGASSKKARRELGYRTRPLERTLRSTIEWYEDLIARGVFAGRGASPLSVASLGLRAAQRVGAFEGLRGIERWSGRRIVAGG
jgi:hypothetical protein